jgi:Domain of unknown function (DUF4333)
MRPAAVLASVGIFVALAAGCSNNKTVVEAPSATPSATTTSSSRQSNSAALENGITETLENEGDTVEDVRCPADVSTSKGSDYLCTALVDSVHATLHITYTADNHFVVSEQ